MSTVLPLYRSQSETNVALLPNQEVLLNLKNVQYYCTSSCCLGQTAPGVSTGTYSVVVGPTYWNPPGMYEKIENTKTST